MTPLRGAAALIRPVFGTRARSHYWWNGPIGWDQRLFHPWIIQLRNSTKLSCFWTWTFFFFYLVNPITHTRTRARTHTFHSSPDTPSLLLSRCSRNLLIWPSVFFTLSLPLQFNAALHQRVLSIPAGSCSAAPADLQLLSNTYCQASETCNLSFARRRTANSIHYINKKNGCCYTRQELVFIHLRVRATAEPRDKEALEIETVSSLSLSLWERGVCVWIRAFQNKIAKLCCKICVMMVGIVLIV